MTQTLCTSIFQDGTDQITPERFTAAWVQRIAQMERQNAALDGGGQL